MPQKRCTACIICVIKQSLYLCDVSGVKNIFGDEWEEILPLHV